MEIREVKEKSLCYFQPFSVSVGAGFGILHYFRLFELHTTDKAASFEKRRRRGSEGDKLLLFSSLHRKSLLYIIIITMKKRKIESFTIG